MNSSRDILKIFAATILVVINFFIFRDIFYGQFSFSNKEKIENLIIEKEIELEDIFQQNKVLIEEIELLKNNEDYIRQIAEDELGLVKEDEKDPE